MALFSEKIVIVTGGAGGIGEAICIGFLQEGAKVICLDTKPIESRLRQEIKEHPAYYFRHYLLDVKNARLCRILFETPANFERMKEVSRYNPTLLEVSLLLDRRTTHDSMKASILVNCAGVQPEESAVPAHELPEVIWDKIIDTNLKGAWQMSKCCIPHMLAQQYGVIINIGSVTASHSGKNMAAYAASKGGLIALTRALAVEYAPYIRVLAVSPGSVDTPLLRQTIAKQSKAGNTDEAVKELGAAYPMGRIITPEEVAQVVLFAASDAASAMTGTEIFVDGGVTAQGQWTMRPVQ